MSTTDKIIESYRDKINKDHFEKYRNEGIQAFEKLGIPTLKHEEWKYTDAKKFLNDSFAFGQNTGEKISSINEALPEKYRNIDAYHIVIENGIFREDISTVPGQQGIHVSALKKASESEPTAAVLKEKFNTLNNSGEAAFSALNSAFMADGLFVHVEKNVKVDKPIFVIILGNSPSSNAVFHPRNLISLEQSAQADFIWIYEATPASKTVFINELTEVFIAPNASYQADRLNSGNEQLKVVSSGFYSQGRDSRMHVFNYNKGGNFARNNFKINIEGENAFAGLSGLFFADETAHIDNHVLIKHHVSNCMSDQLFKGVLKDSGQGVFSGRIYVEKDAQKTEAYQSNNNLILSDKASVYTKPQLEIYADDVKCSHGATTGQIDQNALFYLRTRGLDPVNATAMLTLAFAGEAIQKANCSALVELLETEIEQSLTKV